MNLKNVRLAVPWGPHPTVEAAALKGPAPQLRSSFRSAQLERRHGRQWRPSTAGGEKKNTPQRCEAGDFRVVPCSGGCGPVHGLEAELPPSQSSSACTATGESLCCSEDPAWHREGAVWRLRPGSQVNKQVVFKNWALIIKKKNVSLSERSYIQIDSIYKFQNLWNCNDQNHVAFGWGVGWAARRTGVWKYFLSCFGCQAS